MLWPKVRSWYSPSGTQKSKSHPQNLWKFGSRTLHSAALGEVSHSARPPAQSTEYGNYSFIDKTKTHSNALPGAANHPDTHEITRNIHRTSSPAPTGLPPRPESQGQHSLGSQTAPSSYLLRLTRAVESQPCPFPFYSLQAAARLATGSWSSIKF